MYKVITKFADLQDNKHVYHAGDIFPRDGVDVSAKRLRELSGSENKLGIPIIKEMLDAPAEEVNETIEPVEEVIEIEEPVQKPKKGKKA